MTQRLKIKRTRGLFMTKLPVKVTNLGRCLRHVLYRIGILLVVGTILAASSQHAQAQVTRFWTGGASVPDANPGNANWNDPNLWTGNLVPDNSFINETA